MDKLIITALYTSSTLIIVPLIVFCFLPVLQDIKTSPLKLLRKIAAAFIGIEALMFFVYFLLPPILANNVNCVLCIAAFFYPYQKEIALERSHLWFIFLTACLIGSFAYLFYHLINIFLHPSSVIEDPIYLDSFLYQFLFESFLVLLLSYPARKYLGWLVHHFHEEKVWRVIWLVPAGFFAFSIIFIPYDNRNMLRGRFVEIYLMTIFIFFILIFSIYVLFYKIAHSITEKQKAILRNANLEIQAQQYHQLQNYVQETSRLRHDFRYQLTVLAEMLKNQQYQELNNYLEQYINSVSDMPVRYCSSSAVNAILNHYVSICREFDITLNLSIRILENFSVDDTDFCVLLGNLLENAIDSCRLLPKEQRKITLKAGQTAGHVIVLRISNPYKEPPSIKAGRLFSSKHEGEGQGLKSVRLIAEKYNGCLDVHFENQVFEVKILLNF